MRRATEILQSLEAQQLDPLGAARFAAGAPPSGGDGARQLALFVSPEERVADALRALDPNALTPLQALQKLAELKDDLSRG